MIVILLVNATIYLTLAWLSRFAPATANAEVQTEATAVSVAPTTVAPSKPITIDRTDTAAAPPVVVTCPTGGCFHVPGCRYTTTRTTQGEVVKLTRYKRCSVCMPAIGKHWGHAPARLSHQERWERLKRARPEVSGIDSGLSASAEAIYGVGSGLSASAETTYGTIGLLMKPVPSDFAAEDQAPGSSNDVRVPRRMPAMRPPRMSPEAPGRPHPWPTWPASYEVVNWTALLVDAELPSETILQFVGAHFTEKYKWSRRIHWQGIGCSQNCGCCRSANEEDYASGCTSCNDLWEWKCVSRSTLWRVSIYNGLASRWQWE